MLLPTSRQSGAGRLAQADRLQQPPERQIRQAARAQQGERKAIAEIVERILGPQTAPAPQPRLGHRQAIGRTIAGQVQQDAGQDEMRLGIEFEHIRIRALDDQTVRKGGMQRIDDRDEALPQLAANAGRWRRIGGVQQIYGAGRQRAISTGRFASMMIWRVAPPKIIWRMRLCV